MTNAEEFKLPQELHPHENLPFSWKWKEERRDGNDTFPKNCAVCGKTSRGVPSVSCDFCPLVYHLDCLDPPLCEIPTVSIFSIWARFKQEHWDNSMAKVEIVMNELRRFKHSADFFANSSHIIESAAISAS